MGSNYYAIIPANIRYARDLSMLQKLLYAEITSLTQKDWYCWASNTYFAELYDKKANWISRVISDMQSKWYIDIHIDKKAWNTRKIYIWELKRTTWNVVKTPIVEKENTPIVEKNNSYCWKVQDPIVENYTHNNKYNNIINNNKLSEDNLYINPKKIFEKNSFEYQIVSFFIKKQKENADPTFLYQLKNWDEEEIKQKWSAVVEKIKRIDWYSEEQIELIFKYLFTNNFWKDQILSVEKLRKKNKEKVPYFLVLVSEMKKEYKHKPQKRTVTFW